jgi:hypothetical protein
MAMTSPALPRSAALLGAAGVLPTAAALVAVTAGDRGIAAFGFTVAAVYGAAILSFIGGAWWGLAAARAEGTRLAALLGLAVVPSLVAAGALLVLSPAALLVLAAAFALTPLVDARLAANGLAPPWWLRLRLPLSATMSVLHALVAVAHVGRTGLPWL